MKFIWERMKILIEPSSAVPYAAIMEQKIKVEGKRVASSYQVEMWTLIIYPGKL